MYKVFFNSRKIEVKSELKNLKSDKGDIILHDASDINYSGIISFINENIWCNNFYIIGDPELIFDKLSENFKIIEAAGGLVYNNEGKFLGIFRHNMWDLPKGKKEAGESIETTAVREVEEECGLSNVILDSFLCHTYHTYELKDKPILKKTHWYKMKYSGNAVLKPQTEESITEAKWFNKNEISLITENTYPSILEVLVADGLI